MYLKVCGLRECENTNAVLKLQPDYVGFIFTPASPRYYYNAAHPVNIKAISQVKKVGVFVNETEKKILELVQQHHLDLVQLHGDESAEFCKQLQEKGIKIMKAFRLNDEFDFALIDSYASYIAMYLFDAAGKSFGGNGVSFNWQILSDKRFNKPFILSGGISPESVADLKKFAHPDMVGVDVNSRFEIAEGLKDVEALKLFKQQIT